jgi:signal transduction histidine kinase
MVRTFEIELLQLITVAANEASTVEGAMRTALDRVCAHTRWPVGHVHLKDAAGALVSTSLWHLDNPERYETFRKVSEAMTFAPGIGLPGRVLEERKPAWIVDVTKDPNFPRSKAAQDTGLRAGFAFPVLAGEEVVAVMEFFSDEPAEPDDAVLAIMAHVGGQLGRVIERRRAEDALKLASQHKSQFLANMSHELRTPLNAIIGITEMLQEDARDFDREDEFEPLDRVVRAAHHLLALINDILDLSKIETGKMDLHVESFAIAPVVQDVVNTVGTLAAKNENFLRLECPPEIGSIQVLEVVGDPPGGVQVEASFDEFNLDVQIRYVGALLTIPERKPTPQEIVASEDGERLLAGYLLRQSADRINARGTGGSVEMTLHYDH